MNVATLDDWKAALAAAHSALCHGDHGAYVHVGQTWEDALAWEAGLFLASVELGRPIGAAPKEWIAVLRAVADQRSTALDGCVEGPSGIRLRISSLRRAVA